MSLIDHEPAMQAFREGEESERERIMREVVRPLAEALESVMATFERQYQELTDGNFGTTRSFASIKQGRAALAAARQAMEPK